MIVTNGRHDSKTPQQQLRWHEIMSLVSSALSGDDEQLAMQASYWLQDIGNLLERQAVPIPCPEVIGVLMAKVETENLRCARRYREGIESTLRGLASPDEEFPELYDQFAHATDLEIEAWRAREDIEMQEIADEHYQTHGGDC